MGARSDLAAATPQAPLTWEERPRTLRSAPEPTHGNSRSARVSLSFKSAATLAEDPLPFGETP